MMLPDCRDKSGKISGELFSNTVLVVRAPIRGVGSGQVIQDGDDIMLDYVIKSVPFEEWKDTLYCHPEDWYVANKASLTVSTCGCFTDLQPFARECHHTHRISAINAPIPPPPPPPPPYGAGSEISGDLFIYLIHVRG